MKKDYQINSITDAFLALNDIDDEEVVGMVKNFKRVKPLKEGKDISLTTSSNSELEDALDYVHDNSEEDPEIEVIDVNKDVVDHVVNKKDYIGQAILSCNRCKSNRFMDMDKLVQSETDEETYNVEDECPFCREVGTGYELIGQVGKVSEEPEVQENNNEPLLSDEEIFNNEEVNFDNDGSENEESIESEDLVDSDEEEEPELEPINTEEESDDSKEDDSEEDEDEKEAEDSKEEIKETLNESNDDELKRYACYIEGEYWGEVEAHNESEAYEKMEATWPEYHFGDSFADYYVEEIDEEDEDDISEGFKSAANLNEAASELAQEAWMMNQVIQNMNNEEAYYGYWLYTWPDGETRKECEYHFSDEESFNDLKEVFIEVYKEYHEDGLFDADQETLNYAHKWDTLLDLAPIENLKPHHVNESSEEVAEDESEEEVAFRIQDLFNLTIDPETLQHVQIGEYEGTYEDAPSELFETELKAFNTVDSNLVINVSEEVDEGQLTVEHLLSFFNCEEDFNKIHLVDAVEFVELFKGSKEEAIKQFGNYGVVMIEKPETLVITCKEEESKTPEEEAEEEVEESLFEAICRENNLKPYKAARQDSEEYWLKESLDLEEDLQEVFTKYCEGKKCAEAFKKAYSDYTFEESVELKLNQALKQLDENKKLNEGGFSYNQFVEVCDLAKQLGLGDSMRAITNYGKLHGCKDMQCIINCMKNELLADQQTQPARCEKCGSRLTDGGYCPRCDDNDEEYEESLNEKLRMVKKLSESEEPETEEPENVVEEPQIDAEEPEVIPDEKTSDNPEELNDVMEAARKVMDAYQTANKWLDTVKECIYTNMNCPFFSSLVHELAHTMPARFDTFGDILHTINMEIPYPETPELKDKPNNIEESFVIIFQLLDDIKAALNDFIKITDENYHGMSCSAEACLNDIEGEYPMLYRLQAKARECGDDTITFDKFVGQYAQHQGELIEGKVRHLRTRKELKEAVADLEKNNKPYVVKRSLKEGYRFTLFEDTNDVATLPNDAVEPDEILGAPESSESTDVVPGNLSLEEIDVLSKINRIAGDICAAIKRFYDIEVSPALVTADILQDLRLISGAVDVRDLEDNPINNATIQMFNDYKASYEFVDTIMQALTGEEFHTTPAKQLADAIKALNSPRFSTENINKMIHSNSFIEAANRGLIPYLGAHVLEIEESLVEDSEKEASEEKLETQEEQPEILKETLNPDKIQLLEDKFGDPSTLTLDDIDFVEGDRERMIFTCGIYSDKFDEAIGEAWIGAYDDFSSYIYLEKIPQRIHTHRVDQYEPDEGPELEISEVSLRPNDVECIDVSLYIELTEEDKANGLTESDAELYLMDVCKQNLKTILKGLERHVNDELQDNWDDYYVEYEDEAEYVPEDHDYYEAMEVDTESFDKFINEYFDQNYEDTVLYITESGSINNKGVITLHGTLKNDIQEKAVTFTLTPSNVVNEDFNNENLQKVLTELNYHVTNDLSEEELDFQFPSNTSSVDIIEKTLEERKQILTDFLKDCKDIEKHLTPKEIAGEAAMWEYERNKTKYSKLGIDETYIENLLLTVIDEIDFTPLIENEEPEK